ncbi:Excitatory amino acid transporter 5 [Eumeta japonica]|uniref:Amino acid transporter n=1 Tax=Eumeta variegata TaxID=151549 RepID=A0A4C1X0K4_EUMVA|nr:Excitatory amino acid transporter 5 [Eumeta japonica]
MSSKLLSNEFVYLMILKPVEASASNNQSTQSKLETYKIEGDYQSGSNVLGLVCFSVILGITIGKMGEQARPIQDFFQSLSEAMMIITGWVIWLSPLGVFFLVTAKIMEIDSFSDLVGKLGLYFITVLLGLFLHGFGTLTILFVLATKKLPCRYLAKMGQVIATAFGTASRSNSVQASTLHESIIVNKIDPVLGDRELEQPATMQAGLLYYMDEKVANLCPWYEITPSKSARAGSSATMPITIGCCDEMGLDPRITRFVIPIGATINMDGTALYEAVAAIFIAQLRRVEMSFGKIIAISVTATAASIGAAGIPQAGLVTMVMVLDTVNLPAEDVSIILAVDWLLYTARSAISLSESVWVEAIRDRRQGCKDIRCKPGASALGLALCVDLEQPALGRRSDVTSTPVVGYRCAHLSANAFSDRFRTTINVVCDALGAIIVTALSQGDIDKARGRVELDRDTATPHELTEIDKGDH